MSLVFKISENNIFDEKFTKVSSLKCRKSRFGETIGEDKLVRHCVVELPVKLSSF